jgi:hypothetical protein
MINRVIVFRETPKANGTCFPKYRATCDVTGRQVDIDIAAHYILTSQCVLIRVPICVGF